MRHPNRQHKELLALLEDGEYHCPTHEKFMKDDRTRFSELKKMGYVILGDKYCDIPAHNHRAKVKLRKWVQTPEIDLDELSKHGLVGAVDGFTFDSPPIAPRMPPHLHPDF